MCEAARSAARSMTDSRIACSRAVMRPRCRDGSGSGERRGSAPRTGGPPTAANASRTTRSCLSVATRLSTTPAIVSDGSMTAQPCTHAASVRVALVASTTTTTGAPRRLASSAVEWVPSASAPSWRPRLPSMRTRSLAPAPCSDRPSASGRIRNVSRLRPGRPAAAPSHAASMKSGPFLNGATERPRRASARMIPTEASVLPLSPPSPPTTSRGEWMTMARQAISMNPQGHSSAHLRQPSHKCVSMA